MSRAWRVMAFFPYPEQAESDSFLTCTAKLNKKRALLRRARDDARRQPLRVFLVLHGLSSLLGSPWVV